MFDGVNFFVNHKRHSAFQKGMKKLLVRQQKLLTKQKINEGKIIALGKQMVSIAQTTFKEIERF